MKSKFLLWIIALLPLVSYGQANKVPIATVNHDVLSKAVGYQVLLELEQGESHRRMLRDLRGKIEDAETRLMEASNSEELRAVQGEVSFLNEKMHALHTLNTTRRGITGREELVALIKEHLSKDYSIILLEGSGISSNPLSAAVVANVEYVDITESVAALVKREMGVK